MVVYRDPKDGFTVEIDEVREPWRARVLREAGWEIVSFAARRTPSPEQEPQALTLNENAKTDKALAPKRSKR